MDFSRCLQIHRLHDEVNDMNTIINWMRWYFQAIVIESNYNLSSAESVWIKPPIDYLGPIPKNKDWRPKGNIIKNFGRWLSHLTKSNR